ncbi:MAG TPA: XrtA/PEP-CTERM system histidine kinase PrsK [Allosphingosinicella sp.]|uniref:XrtA/PEP-CTERM system histidine kinase PrsK n=1 Tax=Allosphingosinicella sp. TaxID=2823234 RepID=UPI002ED96EDB
MTELIGLWSHSLAAALYGALAVWQPRMAKADASRRPLGVAFAAMTAWALAHALFEPQTIWAAVGESIRNLAFLTFMYGIIGTGADDERQRAVKLVYGAVACVIGLQFILGMLTPFAEGHAASTLLSSRNGLGLTMAAGSLVLVHNLYGQASATSRASIQLPTVALAALWGYELHVYTVAYLTEQSWSGLFAMRGGLAALLAPLFALAAKRNPDWRVQLSRAATFQSLSLVAILAYFIAMIWITRAMALVGDDWGRVLQAAVIIGVTSAALFLLPSKRFRGWLRVQVAKHFFEHRYDYREDWLRFTRTIGTTGSGAPLGERVVKALADVAASPGGLLLTLDGGRLSPSTAHAWKGERPAGEVEDDFVRFLASTSYVVDFSGKGLEDLKPAIPDWLKQVEGAWAGVPLVHNDGLVGLVLLEPPVPARPMDWEDFDLFRTAGIQAASYLAEARTQEALANAERFDEFNRRFAFIMHDIKNLVSQLSLVARNAERHADNPEFRADMVATLQSSVQKMNDLLAKLSRSSAPEAQEARATLVQPVIAAVAEAKRRRHPIEVSGDARIAAEADPARLEQALTQIVQNAIDASPSEAPLLIVFEKRGTQIAIEVADQGCGMSPDFIRTRLFQPFASTKESGFGVGAFEAKTLVTAMGGRIEVDSQEGEGSRFTIFLPAAASAAHDKQRITA